MRKPRDQKRAEIKELFDERLEKAIEREGLSSVMNDTKWDELFVLLEPYFGRLRLRRKDVREADVSEWKIDLYEMLGLKRSIEWLEIDNNDNDLGGSVDLPAVLRRTDIPFSLEDGMVRIWGYTRPGESPNWDRGETSTTNR